MSATQTTKTVWDCVCERCGATWVTKTNKLPKSCAVCRSPLWGVPRPTPQDKIRNKIDKLQRELKGE